MAPPVFLYSTYKRHLLADGPITTIGIALCGSSFKTEDQMVADHQKFSKDASFQIRRALHAPICGQCCRLGARVEDLEIDSRPRGVA